MEDAHITVPDFDENSALFGVFDGHGGQEASKFCEVHFSEYLKKNKEKFSGNVEKALAGAFVHVDKELRTPQGGRELRQYKAQPEQQESPSTKVPNVLQQLVQQWVQSHVLVDESSDNKDTAEKIGNPNTAVDGSSSATTAEASNPSEEANANSESTPMSSEQTATSSTDDHSNASARDCGKDQAASSKNEEADEDKFVIKSIEVSEPDLEEEEEEDGIHSEGSAAGTTSVVAFLQGRKLYVANAGDSRCVLSRNGKAIAMSRDHKPNDEDERKRIYDAGGMVANGRVCGNLNLSRALGDLEYKNPKLQPDKQIISPFPEIFSIALTKDDEFIILACDGIWDVMSNQQAVDFVRERLEDPTKRENLQLICEEMFDFCLAKDTNPPALGTDNMTAVIVLLKPEYHATFSDEEEGCSDEPTKVEVTLD